MTLTPNTEYVVRVIRVATHPVNAEESYRVLVDELPDPAQRRNGVVSLVVRQSIPVFFANPDATPASVTWSIKRGPNSYIVSAANAERPTRLLGTVWDLFAIGAHLERCAAGPS